MKSISDYYHNARLALSDKWKGATIITLIYIIIILLCNIGSIIALLYEGKNANNFYENILILLIVLPLEYAMLNTFLQLKRNAGTSILRTTWQKIKSYWGRYVPIIFLSQIIILILTILTFGILGIVFTYSYRMVPYLSEDYPELSTIDTLRISRKMTQGYKTDLFLLDMYFVPLYIFSILSFGIGLLWVIPYHQTARALFYDDLKAETLIED